MKLPLELRYGLVGAGALLGLVFIVQSPLIESPPVAWLVFRGGWLIPFLIAIIVVIHKRRTHHGEPAFGIQFLTSLWTLGGVIAFAALFAGIMAVRHVQSPFVAQTVILAVGLWQNIVKGLVVAIITTTIGELILKKKTYVQSDDRTK